MHMGHDTENLVGERDLEEYSGIILSPVNREPENLALYINRFRELGEFDIVFDPQLYVPKSKQGYLNKYDYYPKDLETSDVSSLSWWNGVLDALAEYLKIIEVDAVASPVVLPNIWDDDYFANCVDISEMLKDKLQGTGIRVLTTALTSIKYLTSNDALLKAASILSGKDCSGYYIVIESDVEPRREYSDANDIFGMLMFVHKMTNAKKPITIAHCSSDMILFKAAGADNCSTGKFFNLRRFSKSRYSSPPGGGGQLSYWFEHSLMAFLREVEILRIREEYPNNLLSNRHSDNYWSREIISNLTGGDPAPWLALGWRQYLSWFTKTEEDVKSGDTQVVRDWLREAGDNWRILEENGILMEDPLTNGSWLGPWRAALSKFEKMK